MSARVGKPAFTLRKTTKPVFYTQTNSSSLVTQITNCTYIASKLYLFCALFNITKWNWIIKQCICISESLDPEYFPLRAEPLVTKHVFVLTTT